MIKRLRWECPDCHGWQFTKKDGTLRKHKWWMFNDRIMDGGMLTREPGYWEPCPGAGKLPDGPGLQL